MLDDFLTNDVLDIRWIKRRERVSVNGEEFEKDTCSSSRFTFTFNDLMIKLDTQRNSGQNMGEALLWPNIDPEDRKHFATLVGVGSTPEGELWVAQEKIVPDEAPDPDDPEYGRLIDCYYEQLQKICGKYQIWDMTYNNLNGMGNWAPVNGVAVIYDFGLNKQWDEFYDYHCGCEIPNLFAWMR